MPGWARPRPPRGRGAWAAIAGGRRAWPQLDRPAASRTPSRRPWTAGRGGGELAVALVCEVLLASGRQDLGPLRLGERMGPAAGEWPKPIHFLMAAPWNMASP
jgi:hypothetical protein